MRMYKNPDRKNQKTPTLHNRIAVLGAEINESYQSELWRGITEEAGRHSKDLICFLGSRGNTSFYKEEASVPFYKLAHSGNFDGIIVISSAVSTYLDPEQVRLLFDSRPSIPKISIGLPVRGVGSVCVDGREAMRRITEHMILHHNRKHFAVIAGPRRHPESEQRRQTILEVFQSRGLDFDEEMLIYGSFDSASGRDSVRRLLARKKPLDTILCLNDQMAIGAIEELSSGGISVPDTIAVCGFDGIEESEYCSPPLTTIVQPLYEVGATAVRELYRLMEGQATRDIRLPCYPLIRQSCSCESRRNAEPANQQETLSRPPSETFSGSPEKNPEKFFRQFSQMVRSSLFRHGEVPLLEKELEKKDKEHPDSPWSPVLREARRMLWESKTRSLINHQIQKQYRSNLLRNVGTSLSGVFEFSELFENLAEGLLKLGFNHGFLVMYPEEETETKTTPFRLVFRLKNRTYAPMAPLPFDNTEVLPDIVEDLKTKDCTVWMFTPLMFQNRSIGHILLPGTYPDPEIYETLTKQIASSLQGALLLEQVRMHEKSLVQEVRKRTRELTRVNEDLLKEVSTRIRLEQEVVDISKHTMERIGQDLHDDLCQHLAGVSLHVSALRSSIGKNDPDALQIIDSVNRMLSDSIGRVKGIVRGLLPLGIADEGVSQALEILCREMTVSSGLSIEFSGDEDFSMIAPDRAIELYRIVQEALNNSLKHSGGTRLEVELISHIDKNKLFFSATIQDNGKGFSPKGNVQGMGLKIMRYRAERANMELYFEEHEGMRVVCKGSQELING
jgi:DNA-binding LacI/PurR family transcriptional regulator/signal transduction histidine kinase